MRKLMRKGSERKANLPPGTPVFMGESHEAATKIDVIDYDLGHVERVEVTSIEACRPYKDSPTVTWFNVSGLENVELINRIGQALGLHPLVIEDVVSTRQRPKAEIYDEVVYVVVKMLTWDVEAGEINNEQVSLILGKGFVISFQERPGDVFEPLRGRIDTSKGRVRQMGADYLFYALIDSIVDGYFTILEKAGDAIDALEEKLTTGEDEDALKEIRDTRRDMIFLRKSVWPLREAVATLYRGESDLIGTDVQPYLRDVYDHTFQVMDTVESFRDVVAGMQDTYLSNVSNRMNEVMKTLTIIATIFIPLTFIAGIYGMNFEVMPELKWPFGYLMVWIVMVGVALGLLVYFRRKKWL